jgi:ferredoxin--NADP+ reductase
LARGIKLFEIKAPRIARKQRPGQFVIVRLDDCGERIPLTIADANPAAGTITIVVQAIGKTTMLLSMLETGDSILDVVGPLGKASEIDNFGTTVVVSGSVGTAMAYPTARELKRAGNKVISIVGARSKDLLVLEEEVRKVSDETYVVTDDGTSGEKGLVTDKLKELVAAGKVDYVLAVGPVPMMRAVANLTAPSKIKTMVSLNSIMVDGTGMCGGCRVLVNNSSQFACVDGPEFDASQVNFDILTQRNNMYREQERASIERLQADPEGEVQRLRESMATRRECAAIEAGVYDE